jgi:glycosyltransferase involved in cell wall biosynthesis
VVQEQGAPLVTVVTPAYNRAHTLGRQYESLVAQTFRSFEWVIVDDGSEDDTSKLVEMWTAEGRLDIRYRFQENRGKHVAVNRGVEIARGEFTTIIDSDDWFVPNALEVLLEHWDRIPATERAGFSGVVGLCADEDGNIIGDRYPTDPLDCSPVELTYAHGVTGDKHSLLRTDVLRRFPFPFEGLRAYVTEALVWNRMAREYRERHVNEVVVIKEYLPEGISASGLEHVVRGAPATRQFFLEEARLPHALTFRRRMRSHANYVRFSHHAGVRVVRQAREAPSKAAWIALYPLGLGLFARDRWRLRVSRRG